MKRAKLDRKSLRMSVKDLEVGETGGLDQYQIKVLPDRRVYVEKTARLRGVFGDINHPPFETVARIHRKEENKWVLFIFKGELFTVDEVYDQSEFKRLIPINEIVYEGRGAVQCTACNGKGYIVDEQIKSTNKT